jgi:hypothetical protein
MSKKKAQTVVNKFYDEFGVSLVAYQLGELNHMKELLDEFLEQEVETEDLADPDDQRDTYGLDEIEAAEEEEVW